MAGVVILEEDDLVISATQQDIEEYADFLGMNVEEDKGYLWIAEAGLKSALPSPWLMCRTAGVAVVEDRAEVFFFNPETGVSTWDHPSDEHFRRLFIKEKAKNEPCLVVTLYAALAESGAVEISVIGMGGDSLARLMVTNPHETWQVLKRRVKKEIGGKIRMVLPDGRVKVNRKTLIGELFNVEIFGESDLPTRVLHEVSSMEHASPLGQLSVPATLPPLELLDKVLYNMANGCSSDS